MHVIDEHTRSSSRLVAAVFVIVANLVLGAGCGSVGSQGCSNSRADLARQTSERDKWLETLYISFDFVFNRAKGTSDEIAACRQEVTRSGGPFISWGIRDRLETASIVQGVAPSPVIGCWEQCLNDHYYWRVLFCNRMVVDVRCDSHEPHDYTIMNTPGAPDDAEADQAGERNRCAQNPEAYRSSYSVSHWSEVRYDKNLRDSAVSLFWPAVKEAAKQGDLTAQSILDEKGKRDAEIDRLSSQADAVCRAHK